MKLYRDQLSPVAVILALSLIAATMAGIFVYRYSRDTIIAETFDRMTLFHGLRKATLEDYLNSKASDVKAMSRNRRVVQAMQEFTAAWSQFQPNVSEQIKRLYISENPYPLGKRNQLNRARDESRYSEVHEAFHEWAKRFLKHFGYYDLFLIDRSGNILYTVEKEDDFATNLKDGPYSSSPLGEVFQAAMKHQLTVFIQ